MRAQQAARVRGLKVTTGRTGNRVWVRATRGVDYGPRSSGRASYPWDKWLDGDTHTIELGAHSARPGVTPHQLADAARRAGKARGTSVSCFVAPDGLSVTLRSGGDPQRPDRKYPWRQWLDGNLHTIDTSPTGPWGSAAEVKNACHGAAKQRGIRIHAVAGPGKDRLRIWTERPGGEVPHMPWDQWFDGDPHQIDLGTDSPWPWLTPTALTGMISGEARRRQLNVRATTGPTSVTVKATGHQDDGTQP